MITKVCNDCHKPKELNEDNFSKDNSVNDGFRGSCKECISEKDKKRYQQKKKEKELYSLI